MRRKFGQIGLHWFGAHMQVRMSIPIILMPGDKRFVTFRETRAGFVFGFSDRDGYTITPTSGSSVSVMLPVALSRRLLGLKRGVNAFTPNRQAEGYAVWVAIEKKKGA